MSRFVCECVRVFMYVCECVCVFSGGGADLDLAGAINRNAKNAAEGRLCHTSMYEHVTRYLDCEIAQLSRISRHAGEMWRHPDSRWKHVA